MSNSNLNSNCQVTSKKAFGETPSFNFSVAANQDLLMCGDNQELESSQAQNSQFPDSSGGNKSCMSDRQKNDRIEYMHS